MAWVPAAAGAFASWYSGLGAVGTFLVQAAVTTAASYALGRIVGRPRTGITGTSTGVRLENTRDILEPGKVIYGRDRVGGAIRFRHRVGDYLYLIIVWAWHECDAIEQIRFGDETVTLSGNQATGTYAGHMRISHHLGAWDQAADSQFVSELGSMWSSDKHRGRGICYSAIRLEWNQEVFPMGLLPFTAVVRGRKVWDPREGGQDPEDPDTWTWSANSALCKLDYSRGVPMKNHAGEMVRMLGLRLADTKIHLPSAIASANVADEDVPLAGGGNEKRYETHGAFACDSDHPSMLEALDGAMAGRSGAVAGKLHIRAGYWEPPTFDITEQMLRTGARRTRNPLSKRERSNVITGYFTDPEANYQRVPYPVVKSDTFVSADGGELPQTTNLQFTASASAAQRLARIDMLRKRQGIVYEAPYNLQALPAVAGANVRISRDRLGWDDKHFEVVHSRIHLASGDRGAIGLAVDLVCQETHESIWDWSTDLEQEVDPAPNTNLPHLRTAAPPEGLSVVPASYMQADGTIIVRLRAAWTPPGDTFVTSGGWTLVQFRKSTDAQWQDLPSVPGAAEVQAQYAVHLEVGSSYLFRVRSRNIAGGMSDWVQSAPVTATDEVAAPAAPLGLTAITGTGRAVSLDWTDNTEPNLVDYGVYRHTSDNPGAATLIARVRASRFVDVSVDLGTQYWYWVSAFNASLESDKSAGVSATPGYVTAGAVDPSAPSAPSALTFHSHNVYDAGDGTVFAWIRLNVPALPSGAAAMNILYRRSGSSDWIIADQRATGGGTARVDDLSPGVAYQFAAQAFSAFGSLGAVSSTLSRTAPNKATGPAAPTGLTAELANGLPAFSWNANTEKDLAGYEVWRRSEALADGFVNGGFEADFAGWWTFAGSGSAVNISSSGGLGGGKAGRLQVSASGNDAFIRSEALLEVGQTYRVIFWARASAGGVGLRLDAALTGTGWLGGHIAGNVQLTTSYAQYSAEWTVPSTYTQFQFAQGPGSDDEDIFIDKVSIVKVDDWERRATVKVTEFVGRALAPGSVIHGRIRATNNSGQHSDWSSEVILSAPAKPPAPDSGDDVTVSGVNAWWLSPGAVNVNWAIPGADITRVRLRYGIGSPTTIHYDGAPITSTTIGDLAPGEYIVEVTAYNSDSSASDSDSTTIHVT